MSEPLDIDLEATMQYYEKFRLRLRHKIDQIPCDRCGKVATRLVMNRSNNEPIDCYAPSATPTREMLCDRCCRKLHGWEEPE